MQTVTLMPGDGIGPEITSSVVELFSAAGIPIAWEKIEIGLEAFKKYGALIPPTLEKSLAKTKLGLKGPTTTPVGAGHRSVNVTLRQDNDLYANVRPIQSIPGVRCILKDIDIVIVRENSEDLYKGVEYKVSPGVAHGIKIITEMASTRIATYAFEMAKKLKRKKVTAVHKANIMKLTDGLFLDSVRAVAAKYPAIEFNDLIVDNCCMQLVTNPHQFDILVTENLYGDIMSDLASGLIGGLGVAAGGNIGEKCAIFEAVHGSAPDITDKDLANPTAIILSAVMMLEHIGLLSEAKRVNACLLKTLANPEQRTRDLGGTLGTKQFTQALIKNLV